ncbi:hypothetical protein IEO21_01135 [Rhodonia placenta]|uniref:HTH APSES-type domain-containing protein n=2 Tax=Rhodonia placenta TaxID=104341 RepID=A0A1X6MND3_9APHY|nr:hypothetical protein POSPLADRAFT_1061448 [Postia placenta MAD-698-R-SB12]KAF9820908.1 hypothetical protein IEO21_01135 [Postia placenta]OSX57769.1 hypothetical protein POSPLADRAFT_1061448 [Postia placenta MAD-698-R-SB12]
MPATAKHLAFVAQRPLLPLEHANPHIRHVDPAKPPPVKFQEIVRDGQATIVGRLKIQTPNGHAFILRRLDTGAVSLTTMFRAAFPNASEEAERTEAAWVKTNYDISGANKAGRSRFAGTWVNPEVAVQLAEEYGLSTVIPILAKAEPDPNIVYRRSSRAQAATPTGASPAPRGNGATPTAKEPGPGPTKRRREASPAPAATPAQKPAEVVPAHAPTPPPSTQRNAPAAAPTPTPRRSARLKSPAPSAAQLPVPPRTPRSVRTPKVDAPTPTGSDETAVDEDADAPTSEMLAEETMHDDIREQKELIAKLKAQRELRQASVANNEEGSVEDEAEEQLPVEPSTAQKRPREEEAPLKFDFKEPTEEVGERAIVTNSRVSKPQRKSLAWGALAFAAGVGAMTLLPNLQGYLPF